MGKEVEKVAPGNRKALGFQQGTDTTAGGWGGGQASRRMSPAQPSPAEPLAGLVQTPSCSDLTSSFQVGPGSNHRRKEGSHTKT